MKNEKVIKECYWICNNCGKEHKLKTLFCDGCGEERSNNHSYKDKIHEIEIPTSIKVIDWLIMIGAACLMVFFFLNGIRHVVWWFSISIILIIIALIRLFICKTIKLWRRLLVLVTTILLSPIVLAIAFSFVLSICRDILQERANRVDKIALVEACSKIVINPNKYKEKYTDDFSELPEFIEKIRPFHVWLDEDTVCVKLKYGSARYSFLFFQDINSNWNLNSYYGIKNRTVLLSNIVINTNTGEVTIPEQ